MAVVAPVSKMVGLAVPSPKFAVTVSSGPARSWKVKDTVVVLSAAERYGWSIDTPVSVAIGALFSMTWSVIVKSASIQ